MAGIRGLVGWRYPERLRRGVRQSRHAAMWQAEESLGQSAPDRSRSNRRLGGVPFQYIAMPVSPMMERHTESAPGASQMTHRHSSSEPLRSCTTGALRIRRVIRHGCAIALMYNWVRRAIVPMIDERGRRVGTTQDLRFLSDKWITIVPCRLPSPLRRFSPFSMLRRGLRRTLTAHR